MVERLEDITQENYIEIITDLLEEEEASRGLVKNEEVVKFLERWFE